MTPNEYAATVIANRIFGRQQVRQKMRALAAEYGLDPAILDPPKRPHRLIRLVPDIEWDPRRSWLIHRYVATGILEPEAHVVITDIAS